MDCGKVAISQLTQFIFPIFFHNCEIGEKTIFVSKVGCIFPMVIWSEFRMRQYRDDDHPEDAPHFRIQPILKIFWKNLKKYWPWRAVETFLTINIIFLETLITYKNYHQIHSLQNSGFWVIFKFKMRKSQFFATFRNFDFAIFRNRNLILKVGSQFRN